MGCCRSAAPDTDDANNETKQHKYHTISNNSHANENADTPDNEAIHNEQQTHNNHINENKNGFDKIADGLKVYYQCFGRDQDEISQVMAKFLKYCKDEGFEEDSIDDELTGNPEDCMLLDPFNVANFPFLPEANISNQISKLQEIVGIIKYCYENPGVPKYAKIRKMNKINEWILQLDRDECIRHAELCRHQLKKTFTQCKDHTFYYGLYLSLKNKFPIIQYLTAVYTRQTVQNMLNEEKYECNVSDWVRNTIPMTEKQINIPIIDPEDEKDEKDTSKDIDLISVNDFLSSVLNLYIKRLAPELRWYESDVLIDDAISDVADSITAAINFIKPTRFDGLKFPLQFDFVIAVNDIVNKNSNGSGDKCTDFIGDICDNLKQNNCVYYRDKYSVLTSKCMDGIYKIFLKLMNEKHGQEYMEHYPRKRRLVAFLDRRQNICKLSNNCKIVPIENKNMTTLTFYEPPADCREFPDDYMAEWFMESTRTCIIPKLLTNIDHSKIQRTQVTDVNTFMMNKSALTNCEKLLTFSFHVEAKNEIRCYMWWRGECMMFLPHDLENVLPKIFHDSDRFKFDGYDHCQWKDEKFDEIYQILATNNNI